MAVPFHREQIKNDPVALGQAFPVARGTFLDGPTAEAYTSHLPGAYNHRNIALAAAVAHYFKVPLARVSAAVAAYTPDNSRSEVRSVGASVVLLDAYNANPDSTLAGLRWLASRREPQKVALLGTLAELGAYAKTAHAEILAAARGISGVEIGLFGGGWDEVEGSEARFTEVETARAWLGDFFGRADTVILIKGSRSNRLERVLPQA